ncbi:MAG: hypothetical protein M9907_06175 [Burkholderiaceae bacterium]|nr:hypothetical protein [Burkholderiaceae bacterium]
MRPTEGVAGRSAVGADRESAEDIQRTEILAERDDDRKQLPDLGNCAGCGARIRLIGRATICPTCSAWRRWYIAHRIASRYLREVAR